MKTEVQNGNVIEGDCLSVLPNLPENQFHAIVTDPPYNFEGGFMQEKWDDIGSPKEYQNWCKKWAEHILPTLKPGGHLLAFSGSRSHHRLMTGIEDAGFEIRDTITWHYGSGFPKGQQIERWLDDEYKEQYGDWRGMLKPSTEFVALARAPLDGSSSTRNQMKHGTGNLNVEACRLKTDGESDEGRFPVNLMLDPVMAEIIDQQSGVTKSTGGQEVRGYGSAEKYGDGEDNRYDRDPGYGDVGGASRFFYCSKASKSERTHNGEVENNHNTVKPLDLMKWLVKMVTDEDQWVLDPFAGSGTTLCAAEETGRKSVGIEQSEEYAETARKRFGATLIES